MNVPTKQIIFIRHGVAEHNIRPADGCSLDLTSPTLFDPPLIYNGKQGALVAGEQIRHYLAAHKLGIELIVVSPLTRCIQTATLMFLPSTGPVVPMVCHELTREACGKHYPDKRRRRSELIVGNCRSRFEASHVPCPENLALC